MRRVLGGIAWIAVPAAALTIIAAPQAGASTDGWCKTGTCAPATSAGPDTCIQNPQGIEWRPAYGYYRPDGC